MLIHAKYLLNPFPPLVCIGSGPSPLILRPLGQGHNYSHCPKSFLLQSIFHFPTKLSHNGVWLNRSLSQWYSVLQVTCMIKSKCFKDRAARLILTRPSWTSSQSSADDIFILIFAHFSAHYISSCCICLLLPVIPSLLAQLKCHFNCETFPLYPKLLKKKMGRG